MSEPSKATCDTIKVDEMDCPRCGKGPMQVIHSSWYCTHCKFKEGCCG
jgi:ribosomal protein S27AE